MDHSQTLLSAQVHFLEVELALIHVPLSLYNLFIPSILKLLIPDTSTNNAEQLGSIVAHAFLNVSVTPVECSIACSRELTNQIFVPVRNELKETLKSQISISQKNYVVMQVDGEGLGAGQRVVELTSPLAMKGISIFFISTYTSDYILVPHDSRSAVVEALEARGFTFESSTDAFVNIASSSQFTTSRHNSAIFNRSHDWTGHTLDNTFDWTLGTPNLSTVDRPPPTPPPSSLDELKARTLTTLMRGNVVPQVNTAIRLVQCAERKPIVRKKGPESQTMLALTAMRMQFSLLKCLTSSPPPRFFSMTLAEEEAASFLLEQQLLIHFEDRTHATPSVPPLLLGDLEGVLIPIMLDLRDLPMESTGIVCGVAGMLVTPSFSDESDTEDLPVRRDGVDHGLSEMGYLSTSQAGNVIVPEGSVEQALKALAIATKQK